MKSKALRKTALTAVVTLSTASVYFAQSAKDSLKSKDLEGIVLTGVADIAKERKTPIAVSTIKEAKIIEKLGNQEFPEILNTTPSVYATKGGGGFGDSKINIRGFEQANIAVMINGMPINDMETGAVYWSNWAGLSDVTSAMQVQRGLGASKLAIASVGGTINIVTRAADKKRGAVVSVGVGNNDYHKALFAYNSGKSENGWATSFLMSRTAGSTYADATQFEGYNYYFALGYQPNRQHDIQFTITGAPQWHNQRAYEIAISDLQKRGTEDKPSRTYNADWGYLNGKSFNDRVNYYHKPVMSLNWDWKINPTSQLSTVLYASFGRGGGTGNTGKVNGKSLGQFARTSEGLIDFDAVYAANQASTPDQGTLVRRASINSHNWFGIISSFNHKINENLNFTVGVDGRYYYGYHYQVVSDLIGASAYKDTRNQNLSAPNYVSHTFEARPTWNPFGGKQNDLQDKISYSNDGEVRWYGGFGQLEYSNDRLSAFVQGAISNQGFQRIDNFIVDGQTTLNGKLVSATNPATDKNPVLHTKTGFKDILGYNVKAGANFNIDEKNNVFANIGYYSKQPFLNAVYPNNKNYLNPNLTNEKIFGIEAGYGFRTAGVNVNLNVYRTSWKDRFLRKPNQITLADGSRINAYANIEGITEIHQGVELEARAKVNKVLSLNGMFSFGDWYYKGDANGYLFDETNQPIDTQGNPASSSAVGTKLYLDNVKVGDAAQMTASIGAEIKPVENIKLDATYRYVNNLYARLNLLDFTTEKAADKGALKLPAYGLFDLGVSFKIPLNNPKQYFTLRGNVYNLFDTYYIQNSYTNLQKDRSDFATDAEYNAYANNPKNFYKGIDVNNKVFLGFGRTWAATMSFHF
ncbi:TonB-dependent receptor [Riemerella columbina]|uniref:TonB-dependent receptor n=1 Tax=Riemerella columbina TaxID=103810 RepID=UPI002670B1E7|nr:TonB-dependent receptor plug domain-containing protein [Riemerella columbina]WKS95009.1 TonB-dependent receptor plug domain-containing protein [Riemerella columbina]